MFMTCSTSYCICDTPMDLWNECMYVWCVCVCVCVWKRFFIAIIQY